MAEIKGISLKSVKSFRGHEGEPLLQGNLYYKGKKIGFFSQDSWGGPDQIMFDDRSKEKELKPLYNQFVIDHPEYDWDFTDDKQDCFYAALIDLTDLEAQYKKYKKQNFTRMAIFEDDMLAKKQRPFKMPEIVAYIDNDAVEQKVLKEHNAYDKYRIFKSLDDFVLL